MNLDPFDVVIVAAKRTAMGSFQGSLSSLSATQLGSLAIEAALSTSGLSRIDVDEVIMGNVLSAGLGQAPARQAALGAKLPESVACTTVSKVCGSGMRSVMMAVDQLRLRQAQAIIAGGMESMSNAPYFLPKARWGYRVGHGQVVDHMFYDGLEDAYTGRAMGSFAQATADARGISRQDMDQYAVRSLQKAQYAINERAFSQEIVPVEVTNRHEMTFVDEDEQPSKASAVKIPTLKPAFEMNGTITAANSSSISDGAAALLLTTAQYAQSHNLVPMCVVKAHASHAQAPSEFTTAPIGAINKLLKRLDWTSDSVDLWEINEAFAMVAMMAIEDLGLDTSKVNINGGACALGHPIGASGARIIVTLLHSLHQNGLKRGVASLCIGGGEATALGIEVI